jgi:hypothetical protein
MVGAAFPGGKTKHPDGIPPGRLCLADIMLSAYPAADSVGWVRVVSVLEHKHGPFQNIELLYQYNNSIISVNYLSIPSIGFLLVEL